ncbi:MAG TPA: hypothetical protein VIK04_02230 [Solirubrobacteraceae bacterium]
MVPYVDPGGLLARYYTLERGPRVCLRLVRGRDAAGVRALCERRGTPLSELGLARLIHFDLAAQLVLCATALIDSAETVVGFGAIALADGRPLVPSLVVVDQALTEGLDSLLADALVAHGDWLLRARAA